MSQDRPESAADPSADGVLDLLGLLAYASLTAFFRISDDASLATRAADCFEAAERGFTASGLLEEAEEMRRYAAEARDMF